MQNDNQEINFDNKNDNQEINFDNNDNLNENQNRKVKVKKSKRPDVPTDDFIRLRKMGMAEAYKKMEKEAREIYKKPVTKREFLESMDSPIESRAYKYCTTYSTKCLREVIKILEKKPADKKVLSAISHEMSEILNPYIRSETILHVKGVMDEHDVKVAGDVYNKIKKEYSLKDRPKGHYRLKSE